MLRAIPWARLAEEACLLCVAKIIDLWVNVNARIGRVFCPFAVDKSREPAIALRNWSADNYRMPVSDEQILEILGIAHATSMRGLGLSLRDAIGRAFYKSLRSEFDSLDLLPHLRSNPNLITQWLMYSEDKRSSGGYWVSEKSFEVGSLESPDSAVRFGSIEEAVANFIVRELDYWSKLTHLP